MQSYNTGKPLAREICCVLSYGPLYATENIIPKSQLGMVFTTQYIQVLRVQKNTFHEPVACHLYITAPNARFGLFSIIQNIHSDTNIPVISQELHLRFPFLWIMIS